MYVVDDRAFARLGGGSLITILSYVCPNGAGCGCVVTMIHHWSSLFVCLNTYPLYLE